MTRASCQPLGRPGPNYEDVGRGCWRTTVPHLRQRQVSTPSCREMSCALGLQHSAQCSSDKRVERAAITLSIGHRTRRIAAPGGGMRPRNRPAVIHAASASVGRRCGDACGSASRVRCNRPGRFRIRRWRRRAG
jgi:hypothetical protein